MLRDRVRAEEGQILFLSFQEHNTELSKSNRVVWAYSTARVGRERPAESYTHHFPQKLVWDESSLGRLYFLPTIAKPPYNFLS